ncbi:hypothetical protein TIFTF001_049603, partial [Ficus carica]
GWRRVSGRQLDPRRGQKLTLAWSCVPAINGCDAGVQSNALVGEEPRLGLVAWLG